MCRKLAVACLALAALVVTGAAPPPQRLLVIVTGESNSGGYAVNTDATPEEVAPRPAVQILDNATLAFQPLDIGTNNLIGHDRLDPSATHGIELELVNRVERLPADSLPVYLVKTGQGGSTIGQWAPNGKYFDTFRTRVAAAKKLLADRPLRPVIFFSLGINDAIAKTPVARWKQDVKDHLARLRQEVGGDPPIVMTRFMPRYEAFNAAIAEICAEMQGVYSVETRDAALRDDNHWSYAGMKVVAGLNMPSIGSMLCRELANPELAVPHHVMFTASAYRGGHYTESPGFYGSQWGPINVLPDHIPPRPPFRHLGTSVLRLSPNSMGLPSGMTVRQHAEREQIRARLSQAFQEGRNRDAVLMGHSAGYSRVRGLMDCSHLYDIEKEPRKIRDAYGLTGFAQQTLLARRLVEAGVPFVRVNFGWWDTHGQNFEAHQEMVPELDHVMTTLLDDLATRGLLEHTLVVTFSEMGRTPKVNENMGRDHFSRFSVSLSGCGIRPVAMPGSSCAGQCSSAGTREPPS